MASDEPTSGVPSNAERTITVVHRSTSDDPAGKGIWSSSASWITSQATLSAAEIRDGLHHFCISFNDAIEGLDKHMTNYELKTIEVSIDLTAKGEVRLISSTGAEIKGGIKLVFSR